MVLNEYRTKHNRTLKVYIVDDPQHKDCKLYDFTLHEKKPHGENITVLNVAIRLTTPDYFIKKYTDEY